MSALNGGWASKGAGPEFPDLVEQFGETITAEEWAHLRELPALPDWIAFVTTVVQLREFLSWEMADPQHPLQSAATVAARTAA